MNRLHGTLTAIQQSDSLRRVVVEVEGTPLTLVSLELPDAFREGAAATVVFKESEVILATGNTEGISIANRIPAIVKELVMGEVLAEVALEAPVGTIISLITAASAQRLGLAPGKPVTALIKANELSLTEPEDG